VTRHKVVPKAPVRHKAAPKAPVVRHKAASKAPVRHKAAPKATGARHKPALKLPGARHKAAQAPVNLGAAPKAPAAQPKPAPKAPVAKHKPAPKAPVAKHKTVPKAPAAQPKPVSKAPAQSAPTVLDQGKHHKKHHKKWKYDAPTTINMACGGTAVATTVGGFAVCAGTKLYGYFKEGVPEDPNLTLDQAKAEVEELRNDLNQPYNTKAMYEGAVTGICVQLGRNIAGTRYAGTHARKMRAFMRPDVERGNITQEGWAYIYQVLSNPPAA